MSTLRPAASVRFRRVGEEAVLLSLDTMLYYQLDEVGAFAWERLEAGETLDRIAEAIAETFAVDAETARRDLDPLVESLVGAGLLVETA
jgi:Coenzyme PQQ synthesis protein D (PqqD)